MKMKTNCLVTASSKIAQVFSWNVEKCWHFPSMLNRALKIYVLTATQTTSFFHWCFPSSNLIIQLRRGLKLGQVSIYCHKLKLIHLYRFSPRTKKKTYLQFPVMRLRVRQVKTSLLSIIWSLSTCDPVLDHWSVTKRAIYFWERIVHSRARSILHVSWLVQQDVSCL